MLGDELDFQRHIDYVHVNPRKHGLLKRVCDWPFPPFHRYVAAGIYTKHWCGNVENEVGGGNDVRAMRLR